MRDPRCPWTDARSKMPPVFGTGPMESWAFGSWAEWAPKGRLPRWSRLQQWPTSSGRNGNGDRNQAACHETRPDERPPGNLTSQLETPIEKAT